MYLKIYSNLIAKVKNVIKLKGQIFIMYGLICVDYKHILSLIDDLGSV